MKKIEILNLSIFLFFIILSKNIYAETTITIIEPVEKDTTVRTGLDVLIEDHLNYLDGKKIGLVTNHSGLTRTGIKNYAFFQRSRFEWPQYEISKC